MGLLDELLAPAPDVRLSVTEAALRVGMHRQEMAGASAAAAAASQSTETLACVKPPTTASVAAAVQSVQCD